MWFIIINRILIVFITIYFSILKFLNRFFPAHFKIPWYHPILSPYKYALPRDKSGNFIKGWDDLELWRRAFKRRGWVESSEADIPQFNFGSGFIFNSYFMMKSIQHSIITKNR